jgi:hypothetical protein
MGISQDDLYGELRHTYDHDTATALIGAVREEIAHELAEKIRDGAVGYNAGEYSKASQIGPGRVMEFTQSAIADWIDPESS